MVAQLLVSGLVVRFREKQYRVWPDLAEFSQLRGQIFIVGNCQSLKNTLAISGHTGSNPILALVTIEDVIESESPQGLIIHKMQCDLKTMFQRWTSVPDWTPAIRPFYSMVGTVANLIRALRS